MRDEDLLLMDELVLRLLAAEGGARDCASRASSMIQDGNEASADALALIGRRYATEAKSLRAKLAMLHLQTNEPGLSQAGGNVVSLRFGDHIAITIDEVHEHLAQLKLGEVLLLSKGQFEQTFSQSVSLADSRWAAIRLAEENGCRLMFREGRDPYVVITRRQRLSEVISLPSIRGAA